MKNKFLLGLSLFLSLSFLAPEISDAQRSGNGNIQTEMRNARQRKHARRVKRRKARKAKMAKRNRVRHNRQNRR